MDSCTGDAGAPPARRAPRRRPRPLSHPVTSLAARAQRGRGGPPGAGEADDQERAGRQRRARDHAGIQAARRRHRHARTAQQRRPETGSAARCRGRRRERRPRGSWHSGHRRRDGRPAGRVARAHVDLRLAGARRPSSASATVRRTTRRTPAWHSAVPAARRHRPAPVAPTGVWPSEPAARAQPSPSRPDPATGIRPCRRRTRGPRPRGGGGPRRGRPARSRRPSPSDFRTRWAPGGSSRTKRWLSVRAWRSVPPQAWATSP